MKLISYLQEICGQRQLTASPKQIREILIQNGITPSIGQVKRAMAKRPTGTNEKSVKLNCPTCPNGQATEETHDQDYHDQLLTDLRQLKISLTPTISPRNIRSYETFASTP